MTEHDEYDYLLYFSFSGARTYHYRYPDKEGNYKDSYPNKKSNKYYSSYFNKEGKTLKNKYIDTSVERDENNRYYCSPDTLRENTIANILQFATGNIPVSTFRKNKFIKWDAECVRMAKDSVVSITNIPTIEQRTTVKRGASSWSKTPYYFLLDGILRESDSGYFSMTQLRLYIGDELWNLFSMLIEKYCPEHIYNCPKALETLNTKKSNKDIVNFTAQCIDNKKTTIHNIINCILDSQGKVKSANSMKQWIHGSRHVPNIVYRGTPQSVMSLNGIIIVPCTDVMLEVIKDNFIGGCTILDSGFCYIDKITQYRDNYFQEGKMPEHFHFGIIKE